jgi:hypothetical protein
MRRSVASRRQFIAVFVAAFALAGLTGLLPEPTAASGLFPDMRGNWQGRLMPEGLPVATPVGITMNVTTQGIGNFTGTFTGPDYVPGTLTGSVSTTGVVTFSGDAPDVDLSHGRATIRNFGDGAAILDGTVTVDSTYPFYAGIRNILEIRPFVNHGDCPCTPRVGDYIGTWGSGGTSGPIQFTVQAADHTTPTKFTSYLYLTIDGQQHGLGLIGTANADGDVVAIAHANTGRLVMTAVLTDATFLRPSRLDGSFTFEMNDGTVLTQSFSAVKQ